MARRFFSGPTAVSGSTAVFSTFQQHNTYEVCRTGDIFLFFSTVKFENGATMTFSTPKIQVSYVMPTGPAPRDRASGPPTLFIQIKTCQSSSEMVGSILLCRGPHLLRTQEHYSYVQQDVNMEHLTQNTNVYICWFYVTSTVDRCVV